VSRIYAVDCCVTRAKYKEQLMATEVKGHLQIICLGLYVQLFSNVMIKLYFYCEYIG